MKDEQTYPIGIPGEKWGEAEKEAAALMREDTDLTLIDKGAR